MSDTSETKTSSMTPEASISGGLLVPGDKFRCLSCGEIRESKIELMMHQELWDCGGYAAKRAKKVIERKKGQAHYDRLRKIFED